MNRPEYIPPYRKLPMKDSLYIDFDQLDYFEALRSLRYWIRKVKRLERHPGSISIHELNSYHQTIEMLLRILVEEGISGNIQFVSI